MHTNNKSTFLNTERGKTKSNAREIPSISLPKGGGAIKGVDEKFSVNAMDGTSSFSILLPSSESRGLSPTLSLSYNSGSGNGIFGLGWSLHLGSIKRKTNRELPKYLDDIDSDIYLFSEAEDLVPEYKKESDGNFLKDDHGEYIIHEFVRDNHTIRYYKPRIEGLYARIERWINNENGTIKWRVITKDNLTTLFGWSSQSRIVNPKNKNQIFEWLPEFVFDDKGNSIRYLYKKEDSIGFDRTLLHNKNRHINGEISYTNLYLEEILYGNRDPYDGLFHDFPNENSYMFKTVFEYGDENGKWDFREDAFSSYRSGFEIRTTRLCKRVSHYHIFSELSLGSSLVKSVDFTYDISQKNFTFLLSATSYGYIRKSDGTYSKKSMPSMEFTYQNHEWSKTIHTLPSESLSNTPSGLDESQYQFTDLYNEGLSGILTEQGNAWYYKHNLGDGHFESAKKVTSRPSFSGLGRELQFADLEADGRKQLVHMGSEPRGYFELSDEEEWENFNYFDYIANINLNDPNTRMLDLTGDGKPDLVISEESAFVWYESLGKKGYASAKKVVHTLEEEQSPTILFSDMTQSIFLADMSGDGLVDIVRIRNGDICYWSNLGYGKFGTKISMDNAPWFDHPERFNPSYLRIADIDGSGVPDIIYLGRSNFSCWMNLGGNSFSKIAFEIADFPHIDNLANITVTDLLGNGLGCIVWSSSLEKDAQTPLKYINLTNSKKPHIMTGYNNGLGKEVTFTYKPSTKYYIEDKLAGNPWITKLPFPVYCVEKTETKDSVRGSSFVSSYTYHHGYYDHKEREFRGFGMVEQRDIESFEGELDQTPVVTKSWFHTGKFINHQTILNQYAHEYWYEIMKKEGFEVESNEVALDKALLVEFENLSAQEWQEAVRSCKGTTVRSEIFSLDRDRKKELTPYVVTMQNYKIELLQPKGKNRHAVFSLVESESLNYNYERVIEDPRVTHSLNIEHDEYGNVLESATVVYPRRDIENSLPTEIKTKQAETNIIFMENHFTNDITDENNHRLRLPSEVKTYELKGVTKEHELYILGDFKNILQSSTEVAYHQIEHEPSNGTQKRLIEHIQSLYLKDDLTTALPLALLESKALPYENYQLAYTPELLNDIYEDSVDESLMEEGKFCHRDDNNWWISSGGVTLSAEHFYLPTKYSDPYGAETHVEYDSNFLYIKKTTDALGHQTSIECFNFYTLSPQKIKDQNDNISEVLFDELGLIKAVAIKGKGSEADDLDGLSATMNEEESSEIKSFFATEDNTLTEKANQLLQHASIRFVYDFDATPVVVASITREEHYRDNPHAKMQIAFEYSDGMGEVVMKKVQTTSKEGQPRWIVNGRKVLNNKGNPVKEYEPYFSLTPKYDSFEALSEIGVTPILYYDAMGRVVKTLLPNGTFSKELFESWKITHYDVNDTVLDSKWYEERMALDEQDKERISAQKSVKHANTPTVEYFDTLGRAVLSISHNRDREGNNLYISTVVDLDIESNLRCVTDARKNKVMQYKYDMLGNLVYQDSMDKGKRWLLINILGNPLQTWDERNHEFSYFYDILHRPTHSKVKDNTGLDNIYEKIIYGEEKSKNLVGQVLKLYDTGGVIETPEYDFKGQSLSTSRKLFKDYKSVANWTETNMVSEVEDETYIFINKTDALGRVIEQTTPDNRKITFKYSEAGTLKTQEVDGQLYIEEIEYNEKGQREKIVYGNGVVTTYAYDRETFALKELLTLHGTKRLQDIHYTYDPIGNITHIENKIDPNTFYNNEEIKPNATYTYDALYQLIEATGRENSIKPSSTSMDKNKDNWNDTLYKNPSQMRSYIQRYNYDKVGNIMQMQHSADRGNWTRDYEYEEYSNRLKNTQVGESIYPYHHNEKHGYIDKMPHLQEMGWNFKEELVKTIRQRRTDGGTAETTYYQYDAEGQRIRKITENQASVGETPTKKDERIYLGNYEIYHQHSGSNKGLKRVTLSLMDEEHRFVMIESRNEIDDGTEEQLIRYQLHNHLGSSSLELNEKAKLISYEEYHPFGTTAYQAMSKTIKATAKRYRYTGMERDEESGFSYHSARYYLPWLGRWLSGDPIGIGDGVNVYAYVGNSPVIKVDLDGRKNVKGSGIVEKGEINIFLIKTTINTTNKDNDLLEFLLLDDDNDIEISNDSSTINDNLKALTVKQQFQQNLMVLNEGKQIDILEIGTGEKIDPLRNIVAYKEDCGRATMKGVNKYGYTLSGNGRSASITKDKYFAKGVIKPTANDLTTLPIIKGKEILDIIDENLYKGIPVIVGIDSHANHGSGGSKPDGITDHWAFIIGRSYEGGHVFYFLADNATTGKEKNGDYKQLQKLYVDSKSFTLFKPEKNDKDNDYVDQRYTIVNIREVTPKK